MRKIFRFFDFFDFPENFRFFGNFDFLKDFNCKCPENFHLEKYFSEKIFFGKIFQVDITSSDLNEFWIGQKILKADVLYT